MTQVIQPRTAIQIEAASIGPNVSRGTQRILLPPDDGGGGGGLPENPSIDPTITALYFDALNKTLILQGTDFGYVVGDVENSYDGADITVRNDDYGLTTAANASGPSDWTSLTEVHIPLRNNASRQLTWSAWREGFTESIEGGSLQTALFAAGWTLNRPSYADLSESINIVAQNVSYPSNIVWVRDVTTMVVRGHNFTIPEAGAGSSVLSSGGELTINGNGLSFHTINLGANAGAYTSSNEWRLAFSGADATAINARWVTLPSAAIAFSMLGPGSSDYPFIAGGQAATRVWDINNVTYSLNLDTDRALGILVVNTEGDIPLMDLMQQAYWTTAGAQDLIYAEDYVWSLTPLLERTAFVAEGGGTAYRLNVNGAQLAGLRPQYLQVELLTDANAGSMTVEVFDTSDVSLGSDSGVKYGTQANNTYAVPLTFGADDIGAIELTTANGSQLPAIIKIDLIYFTV